MNRDKELLVCEWRESLSNIRHYRTEIIKLDLWIVGIITITLAFAINLYLNKQYFLCGLTLITLFYIIGYTGYNQKRNVIYFKGSIRRANEIETMLGTKLSLTLKKEYHETFKRDTFDEIIEALVCDPFNLRRIKYAFFISGLVLMILGQIK